MLEGIVVSIVAAYAVGWVILKIVYYFDNRQASNIRQARAARDMATYGRVRSRDEILEEARANVFPDHC